MICLVTNLEPLPELYLAMRHVQKTLRTTVPFGAPLD